MADWNPVLVTGAGGGTGGVGRRVVELLRERGLPVRAMVHREDERDPEPHIGHVYELTGPRSQDMTGVAEEYSRALGRRVSYVDVPFDTWAGEIRWGDGISPHLQAHLTTMARLHRSNYYDRATATVASLIGHPAQTVESFVAGHAEVFTLAIGGDDRSSSGARSDCAS